MAGKPWPVEPRFWARVEKTDDCWLWTGYRDPKGYGSMSVNGRTRRATWVSYKIHYHQPPEGILVCHHCDNPSCVRPDHLFLGTVRDNALDMVAKGRDNPPRGSSHPFAKLTEDKVREIRALRKKGVLQREVAEMYGVTRSHISLVENGVKWRHVK